MFLKKFLNFIKNLFQGKLFLNTEDYVFYVCGTELPAPLSAEEEQQYIDKLSNGDENAKQILIEHNLRLVIYIAKKFDNTNVDMEDLISVGSIGLIKAINSFNNNKNIKLATYASRCIENEILMFLRKTKKIKTEISLEEPLNADLDGNELILSDILATDYDIVYKSVENGVEKQLLWQVILKLPPREQEIMLMRFGLNGVDEKTQKEVADMMNISQSYISRIEKKILGKMEKEMKRLYS